MKKYLFLPLIIFVAAIGCKSQNTTMAKKDSSITNDTIRIANDELEYEIIIIDPGFNSWLLGNARPRNFHSQNYLESRNRIWVNEWNIRALQPQRYRDLYQMQINYQNNIDYGYEVNYMLFNYLTYFQITNKIKLGSFEPRI